MNLRGTCHHKRIEPQVGPATGGHRQPARLPSVTITAEVRRGWRPMRAASMLAILAIAMTAGCLDDRAPEPEVIVVTVTQEAPARMAEPIPTWQQWLGEQVAKDRCGDPSNSLMYRNEDRNPPYSADFYCRRPTGTPDAAGTQVEATVTAASPPTRPPRATLAPVSTPTPTWRQTATPFPTPSFEEWRLCIISPDLD